MLYSTKRKWDKLMNNNAASSIAPKLPLLKPVTAPSSPTKATVPSAPATPVDLKKRRFADTPKSAGRPSIRAVSPTGSIRSTRSTRSTVTTISALRPDSKAYASYAPWDRDAFLYRLGTFRFVDRWSAKPAAVNEVAWARRGWVCFDKNRVRCTTCRNELLVKVETDDEQTEQGKAVVEKYHEMVLTEHDESCLWRKRGCDDAIYRLSLSNGSVARPAFAARYVSLIKIRNEIPPCLSYPDDVDPATLHFPSDCMGFGPVFETAAMLALFGWQNEDPGIPSLVSCTSCFRRLGLWLFRKKPVEEGQDLEEGEASVCRLDLIGEHRDYCPWVNATSQGKEAGWKTMLRVLQHPQKGMSGAASVYSIASITTQHSVSLTSAERDAEDESRLKKLRRLKSLYFGKKKKDGKKTDMDKGTEKETV